MDSERWNRIDALFAAALELEGDARNAFLDRECANDEALRREVESMLRFARDAADFLETPALSNDATTLVIADTPPSTATTPRRVAGDARFVPGDIIANRYRIVGLLGRGGMGEVYRADDLKLAQPVALKFLSEQLARDGAALARFHREVSVARTISHRHVCRVYDIGEHEGLHFLSMEYVRGEELSSLLKRIGRLPYDKAVATARQLCAGLAAIHTAGVLHRDLKPVNVMVDEHGDVRITDFGIAALAGVRGREAMVGTPAYMAPEAFAGMELTVRADLYSLGLVLYEAFTGKRPFASTALEDVLKNHAEDTAPTRPSTYVDELDPAVERVILRCLEKDPERRPATALQVAAALPGGDPLAAALAAGETPSPQMVAAAAKEGSLRARVAVSLLFAIVLAIGLIAWFSATVSLHRLVPLERSIELLRADAAEIVREAGYGTAVHDRASAFTLDAAVLEYVRTHDARLDRWQRMGAHALPAIPFWYRESPRPLVPINPPAVDERDPPQDVPGMVRVRLDCNGKLLAFHAVPREQNGAANWPRFFERAGLQHATFRPVTPRGAAPPWSDARLAWDGVHPLRGDVPLHIEAASYRGQPTRFEVLYPWNVNGPPPPSAADVRFTIALVSFYFGAMALAALLAWRNLRAGRGDRRGAFRLAVFIFLSRLVFWLFEAHMVATLDEVVIFVAGLQSALYWAALLALLYLALEPFVRRRWPELLISWSRLLAGDVRDPLVGRDALIGGALGLVAILGMQTYFLAQPLLGRAMHQPWINSPLLYERALLGARSFLPLLSSQIAGAVMISLILASVVLFFALLTRRKRITIALGWLALYAVVFLQYGDASFIAAIVALIFPTLAIYALFRHGLFALISFFFFVHITAFYPVTTDVSAPYATSFLMAAALLVAIAFFAFRIALGGQKVFDTRLLDD